MDRQKKIFFLFFLLLSYINAQWQIPVQAAHTTYQLSPPSCSTRAIRGEKSLTLNETYFSFLFLKKKGGGGGMRIDHKQKNDKTERARGLGRGKKQEIGKGNQMTALSFQTGG